MTKFLAIKLIEPQAAPALAEPEEAKKKSKWVLFAVAGVLVAVLAFSLWLYLPKLAPQLAMKRFARAGAPRVPQSGTGKPVQGETPPRVPQNPTVPAIEAHESMQHIPAPTRGPIPWFGRTTGLLETIAAVRGKVFTVTTGIEGSVFIEGVLPMDVNIQTEGTIFRSEILESERVLTFDIKKGETEYIIVTSLKPVMRISESLQAIPPYMRGAMIGELDSIARACGLSSVRTVPVDREEVEGGSRYLIGVQGIGNFASVLKFVRAVETSGKMVEVSRFSLEGIEGKPIKEDILKTGFIVRVYDIKTQISAAASGEAPIS